ncbi:hypothetical protein [Terribacillus sp. DMT04]|uniref:hypothetical protein n=1 Tax=Terribacillus sp. DMT04 TaxID=2850441 RepID=UPI001C2CAC90|nr:hypothetical protein [Terribacillus sp. DMT04]QXE02414.1 hypothetical protein KS242_04085 [Terribacillus sp. DMT04]
MRKKDEKLLELFCGVGTFSLPFVSRVEKLAGIEIVENSIESALNSLEKEPLGSFLVTDCTCFGNPIKIDRSNLGF